MGYLGASLAILLPWAAGALGLRGLLGREGAGSWSISLGYGYVLGLLGTAGLLGLQGRVLQTLSPIGLTVLLAVVSALAAWQCHRRGIWGAPPAASPAASKESPDWVNTACLLIVLWLALRGISLAIEQLDRGLYAWDAWSTWAYRARVWVESGSLVSFVMPELWLANRDAAEAALPAAAYPPLTSLLMAWSALGFGGWSESAALLPWLGLYPALGIGFYGQSRRWGASRLSALIFTWLICSLPLLGGQIALAGYADVWLATTLGFAFMAFLAWMRGDERWQGGLALALLLCAALIKSEGVVWASIFLPALLVRWLKLRGWLALGAFALLCAALLAATGGLRFNAPGLGNVVVGLDRIETAWTGAFEFSWQEGVLRALMTHFVVFDTWHLFFGVFGVGLAYAVWQVVRTRGALLATQWWSAGFVWVLGTVLAFFVLFFLTPAAEWVRLGTSVNRISLQFAPAVVFWLMTLWLARRAEAAAKQ